MDVPFVGPAFPFFVVIMMTPLAALDPYNAVPEAPLRTVTDSMSSGLMSLTLLPKSKPPFKSSVPTTPLLTGTPSTTNRGWFEPLNEEKPRMMIREEAPGDPEADVIFTP